MDLGGPCDFFACAGGGLVSAGGASLCAKAAPACSNTINANNLFIVYPL
jgi:hypothetical protein